MCSESGVSGRVSEALEIEGPGTSVSFTLIETTSVCEHLQGNRSQSRIETWQKEEKVMMENQ